MSRVTQLGKADAAPRMTAHVGQASPQAQRPSLNLVLPPQARYKQSLDPTVDEVKKLCTSLRRNAKEERVLFHYNGHGVPRPTVNGEIWVFNKVSARPRFAAETTPVSDRFSALSLKQARFQDVPPSSWPLSPFSPNAFESWRTNYTSTVRISNSGPETNLVHRNLTRFSFAHSSEFCHCPAQALHVSR